MDDRARYDPGPAADGMDDETSSFSRPDPEESSVFENEDENMNINEARQSRCKRLAILSFLLVALVAAAVGIGVAFGGGDDSSNQPVGSAFAFVAPSDDLDDVCSEANVATDLGYETCLEACKPSLCCELVETNPFSCMDTDQAACKTYHDACQYLNKQKSQDISSDEETVDELCSTTALTSEEGVAKCTDICVEFMCCFLPGDEPCQVSDAWCSDYGACSALTYVDADGFDSHEEAIDTVEQACSDLGSYENAVKCSNLCRTAQCCFNNQFPQFDNNSCEHIECEHYTACDKLYGPANMAVDDDDEAGPDEDEDVDDDDEAGPAEDDEVDPYGNMNDGEGEDDDEADADDDAVVSGDQINLELEEVCGDESLNTLQGVQNCFSLCQYHLCCFADDIDGLDDCSIDLDGKCDDYQACNKLVNVGYELPITDQSPEEICSHSAIEQNGPADCLAECSSYLCCEVDDHFRSSCATLPESDDDNPKCDNGFMEACSILRHPENYQEEGQMGNAVMIPLIKQYCTDQNVATPAGREKCSEYCTQPNFRCCVEFGAGSCLLTDPDYCAQVDECQKLKAHDDFVSSPVSNPTATLPQPTPTMPQPTPMMPQATPTMSQPLTPPVPAPVAPSPIANPSEISLQLAEACGASFTSSLENAKQCIAMCQHHLCCFASDDEGERCSAACDLYEPCAVLVENHELPVTDKTVAELCSEEYIESDGAQHCLLECENHMCCLVDPQFQSSCFHDAVNVDEVSEICSSDYFDECSILKPESPPTMDNNELISMVKTHCTDAMIAADEGDCAYYCSYRPCCNTIGAGNCLQTDPEYCEEISECQKLVPGSGELESDTENDDPSEGIVVGLEEKCSEGNLGTLSGFHECYDACYDYLCCFMPEYSDEFTLSCYDEIPDLCAKHSPCSILLETDTPAVASNVVDSSCLTANMETNAGVRECHRVCATHLCCFQDTMTASSCIGLLGLEECDRYVGCAVLATTDLHPDPINHDDPMLKQHILESCTETNLQTDSGRDECRNLCQKRACCFYAGEDRCDKTDETWCNEVEPCKQLFESYDDDEADDDDDFEEENETNPPECNITDNDDVEKLYKCESACYDHQCCFEPENEGGCFDERENWCESYSACSVVYGNFQR